MRLLLSERSSESQAARGADRDDTHNDLSLSVYSASECYGAIPAIDTEFSVDMF